MAIDISKIENLVIDEGSNDVPFILTDTEVTTLYKLAISNNPKIKIKGVVNTTTGTILKYQSYQIKKAWPELVILAQEISTQDWTASLKSNTITEREETKLIVTNISVETLEWQIDDVSLSVITGSYGEQDVRDHLHFDNKTGRIYYDAPTSNAGWVANVQMSFWPSYIEEPEPEDYRTVYLTIRAIAVTALTIEAPSRIDEASTNSIKVAPYPTNNTKSPEGCKYSLQTQYGTLSPSSGTITTRTEFVYYAPEFKDVPWSEDPEGKYYIHQFIAQFYMFGSTTASGMTTFQILMKNTAFKVTCDKSSLVEGEQATFNVLGYAWTEVQKTMVVDETKLIGITEEELRNRCLFENGPYFTMKAPTDNATFSADVKLYIAPPGADPTGDRAFCFNMSMKAIGITSLTLSPQTIGQNIPSVISLTYRPVNHTKGTISYSFACDGVTVSRRDDEHGIYNVFSPEITSEGHDALAYVYSSYIGRTTPLFSSLNKLYVQDIYFNVKFPDGSQDISLDEGQETDCIVDILHISELRKEITVTITSGGSLIDESWVKARLHFSDDTTTDKIWFDDPQENISWSVDLSIRFVASYIPEGSEPPYSQTVTMHFAAREVTGIEWVSEKTNSNSRIAVSPYRKSAYFKLQTLPIDNTKQLALQALQDNPFSVGTIAAGLSMNVVSNGRFVAIANTYNNWVIQGFADIFSDSLDYGWVWYNLTGSTTQAGTPSTSSIIYPKSFTLYDHDADDYIELRKVGAVADAYNYENGGVVLDTKTIEKRVGRKLLNSATTVYFDGNMTENTACFYIQISDKKVKTEHEHYNTILCSHFASVDSDITTLDLPDTIIDNDTDNKVYIRVKLSAIGATGTETTEEITELIERYINDQSTNGTPITIYYILDTSIISECPNILFYDNVFFKAPLYHIYTANNPANLAIIEFINNDTVATSRTVFGVDYPMDDDNNKALEKLMTLNVRPETSQITQVPFFAGTKTSIDQYDENGNLITDILGEAEKGEVNIWENFCGKYEQWTDEEFTKITWNAYGNTVQNGTPTTTSPIYPTHDVYYTADHDIVQFMGCNWSNIFFGDSFNYTTKQKTSTILKYEFTGTENWSGHTKGASTITLSHSPINHVSSFSSIGNVICSHFMHSRSNWGVQTMPNTISESGSAFYYNFPKELIGVDDPPNTDWPTIYAKFKAWLAEQYENGTPVTIWYPSSVTSILYDQQFYTYGSTHRKYTISKVMNDDDTEGDSTKTNNFNPAFVYNTDGSLPYRFFLSRFIPGWHDNDTTSTISMAKGLKSQQRTINSDTISEKGTYYKNDNGELKQIRPVYYGPLMAYTWLAYITYGNLNLKDAVGLGASKISAEAQVFADASGTPLVPGTAYASLYIINNGLLNADTYENYDFNILGITETKEIAKNPITSFRINAIDVGPIYTVITLGNQAGQPATFTATNAIEYYSLNSCYSTTGYSETHYLDSEGNQVVSGYGENELFYNDSYHPVRCLNVENMWGGGNYTIDGTAFIGDTEDSSIAHPIIWKPEDPEQSIEDPSTWEKLDDVNVLSTIGTWDVGDYKYYNSRCAWADEPAGNRTPYRGFNTYNRPQSLESSSKYNWITGTYNDWNDTADFQGMCGLGHTELGHDSSGDYVFVEYLENTNDQYIKLGQYFNDKDEVWVKAAIVQYKGDYCGFIRPTSWNTNSNLFCLGGWGDQAGTSAAGTEFCFWYRSIDQAKYGVQRDRKPHIWHYKDHHFIMEDKGVSIVATGDWVADTDELLLFRGYSNTTCRIYEAWQKRNGYYLYDLVPCYRKSDKKPGMYDRVSGQFFTNANTSTAQNNSDFILGPEIDTTVYQELDCVATSGMQFVDTAIKFTQAFKFNAEFTSAHTSTTTSYIGGTKTSAGVCGLNIFVSSDNRLCLENASGTTYLSNVDTIMPNTKYAIEIEQTDSLFRAKIGSTTTYTSEPIVFDTSLNYYLFNVNYHNAADPSKSFKGKLHSLKLTFNNELKRSYIAVYNKEAQKYGIYDIVDEKYYGNQGAGNFTGPDVLVKVDSLYFGQGQYLDTGWVHKPYSKVEISMSNQDIANTYINPYENMNIFGYAQEDNEFMMTLVHRDYQRRFGMTIGSTAYYQPSDYNLFDWNYRLTATTTPTKSEFKTLYYEVGNAPRIIEGPGTPTQQDKTCLLGTCRNADGSAVPVGMRNRITDCVLYDGSVAPTTYKILEYVTQPDQFAYIDSGYKPNNRTKIEYVGMKTNITNWHPYWGGTSTWSSASFGLYDGGRWFNFNSDTSISKQTIIPTNTLFTLTHDRRWLYVDGTLIYTHPDSPTFQSTNNLYFGSSVPYSNRTVQPGTRINSFKIWEWNEEETEATLVRHFVAVKRSNDNKVGMYDYVTEEFYPSVGYHTFNAGPETGEVITGGEFVTYTPVKHLTPVYNVITKKYGMYDTVNSQFIGTSGDGIDSAYGPIQKVEYIENINGNDPAYNQYWQIDTKIDLRDTRKITVDLDVVKNSPDMNNFCILFGRNATIIYNNGYLCYSSSAVGGVILREKTVEGSKVTWQYDNATNDRNQIHICTSYQAVNSGIFKYKRVTIYGLDETTILGDFIPIRAGNRGGMYDLVSHEVFFNASPDKPGQNKTACGPIVYGPDLDDGVPGDPGIQVEGEIETLARVYGTL